MLNGLASGDQDGDPWTFVWTDSQGNVVGSAAIANVLAPMGKQTFNLTVTDPSGLSATAQTNVFVQDTTPPALTISLSANMLWPQTTSWSQSRQQSKSPIPATPNQL
jgi:hypothetical protein